METKEEIAKFTQIVNRIVQKHQICFSGNIVGPSCGFVRDCTTDEQTIVMTKLQFIIQFASFILNSIGKYGNRKFFLISALKPLIKIENIDVEKIISCWNLLFPHENSIRENWSLAYAITQVSWKQTTSLQNVIDEIVKYKNSYHRVCILYHYYRIPLAQRDIKFVHLIGQFLNSNSKYNKRVCLMKLFDYVPRDRLVDFCFMTEQHLKDIPLTTQKYWISRAWLLLIPNEETMIHLKALFITLDCETRNVSKSNRRNGIMTALHHLPDKARSSFLLKIKI